ncbi:MAG: ABC transporter permease [Candidatus Bathyarchaeota archaeon]|jgi:ABC-type polysaccharide/polyol phosphate export permease
MKSILFLLEYDFKNFMRYKWWIAMLISMNLADLFVMALVFARMVTFDYFKFFSPGVTITALFASAFMIGREINWEVRRSFAHYLLSLPMKRWELVAGRTLAGGLRGILYSFPLLLTTFAFLGFPAPHEFLLILGALFLLATGTAGLSIAIAASTRSFEKFVTARGLLYYMLFFCSTVFYPLDKILGVLPQPLILFAQLNPLSAGADLIRVLLSAYTAGSMTPIFELLRNLLAFSAIFTLGGSFAYIKILEAK